ncbi:MAG: hypothetical protein NWE78_00210 [Candidatus Bathyarchaeota archaeon]|jgi:hypothetical protein|nr:hypothetical protein [Candidatus Bathyarchaeota archaeon]
MSELDLAIARLKRAIKKETDNNTKEIFKRLLNVINEIVREIDTIKHKMSKLEEPKVSMEDLDHRVTTI